MSFTAEPEYHWRVERELMEGGAIYIHPARVNVHPTAVGCACREMTGAATMVREPCWLRRVLFRSTFEKRLERAQARAQAWCDRRNGVNAAARVGMERSQR